MKFILALLIFFLVFVLFLRLVENRLIFFPSKFPQGYWHPEAFGLDVRDCYFAAADGVQLHGWFLKNENAVATLLWCTGNAGNVSDRLDNLSQLSNLPLNVFIFGYRGYGRSDGSPDENGVYLDALGAYDYLLGLPQVRRERIIIFGRSLGGAVAVDLASKRPAAGLILESTFTSARDMAKSTFGVIPLQFIIKTKFDSVRKIKQINIPLLMIHGDVDRTVPLKLGRELFLAANEPKEFYEIAGADHNDTYIVGGTTYFRKLLHFVNQVIGIAEN
ncbi:MAG TPA: alpha/beta hydrolase [bacterium]